MNLITTIIGFGMSATFIVFVCTRIICGRLRASESRQMFEVESRIDLEQPEHRISGLQPVLVSAIPTMKFSRDAFSSVEDAQKQSTCPVCRFPVQDSLVTKRMRQATMGMLRSVDSPETSTEHSRQWLLPGSERSVGNASHPGHLDTVSGNPELAPEEPQTRH
ncbi:hypothetical protein GH714_019700, partial [Hevea brasiliensis]